MQRHASSMRRHFLSTRGKFFTPVRQHASASQVFNQEILMFGWLTTPSSPRCRHAPLTVLSRRARHISPHLLINKLPSLGSVLYLHNSSAQVITDTLPPGLLVTERTLAPLLDVRWLMATSAVTEDGPREWYECMDRSGRSRARLHLLPDTDYLAWEALMAAHESPLEPPVLPGTPPLRPDSAKVVNFRLRDVAGLTVLDCHPSMALSPLGSHVAAHIAHAESVSLYR
jgi:hypothetical protein